MCLSRASRTCATSQRIRKVEIPAKKKPMCFFLFLRERKRGCLTGRWGMGIYEIDCQMLIRRFEKKMQVFSFRRSFTRWFTRCERRTERKSGQNFYGEEKLGGWDFVGPGTSHFLLPPRYKVCKRERGFIFIFTFTFIYFCFFFSKGFNQILMYCPKKRKRKKKKKENQQ